MPVDDRPVGTCPHHPTARCRRRSSGYGYECPECRRERNRERQDRVRLGLAVLGDVKTGRAVYLDPALAPEGIS